MLSVFFIFPVRAKNTFGKKKDKVTRLHFYDLNKNGRMDTYENPSAPVEYRVEHLLSQMTLEEKVGQMLTSLGWPMYERVGEDIRLTPQLEKEIGEYHIGSLWGFMRADPWTQRTLHTGLNPSLAARASNRLQSYVIEHSRLGIPLFLAEECPHGHMAIGTTVFPTSIGQASTWNPETHIYELKTEGEWKAQGNQIYLANHSGGPVRAEFSFQAGQAFTRLTGSFVSETIDIKSAAGTEPEKPPEGITALYLSGNLPRSSTQWETLGEVTVCITQE